MKDNKIIVGVLGLPIRKNGKGWEFFLTQRLAPHRKDINLKWQLAGGELEFGETPEQTLVREFQEELAIIPQILYPYPIVISHTWQTSKSQIILLNYLVDIGNQQPQNVDPDHETGKMGWYSNTEIRTLDCLPNTHNIIDRAQEIIDSI